MEDGLGSRERGIRFTQEYEEVSYTVGTRRCREAVQNSDTWKAPKTRRWGDEAARRSMTTTCLTGTP